MLYNKPMEKKTKIIFLEGLPGIGKSFLTNKIREEFKNVNTVDEIIAGKMPDYSKQDQFWFFNNDDKKILEIKKGINIIDRGPISTLSYNQTRKIIDEDFKFDVKIAEKWFSKYEELLKSEIVKVLYLTNNQTKFSITSEHVNDPYGLIENQKLLEAISLYNCKKYCPNLVIKFYDKSNIEEIINEIFN